MLVSGYSIIKGSCPYLSSISIQDLANCGINDRFYEIAIFSFRLSGLCYSIIVFRYVVDYFIFKLCIEQFSGYAIIKLEAISKIVDRVQWQDVPRFESGVRQSTLADEQYISSRGTTQPLNVRCIFEIASNFISIGMD